MYAFCFLVNLITKTIIRICNKHSAFLQGEWNWIDKFPLPWKQNEDISLGLYIESQVLKYLMPVKNATGYV